MYPDFNYLLAKFFLGFLYVTWAHMVAIMVDPPGALPFLHACMDSCQSWASLVARSVLIWFALHDTYAYRRWTEVHGVLGLIVGIFTRSFVGFGCGSRLAHLIARACYWLCLMVLPVSLKLSNLDANSTLLARRPLIPQIEREKQDRTRSMKHEDYWDARTRYHKVFVNLICFLFVIVKVVFTHRKLYKKNDRDKLSKLCVLLAVLPDRDRNRPAVERRRPRTRLGSAIAY